MFSIKLCGIRTLEDAGHAIEAGADAIGLNFYSKGRRYVAPDTAVQIVRTLPARVSAVALFVNASVEEIRAVLNTVRVDYLQLHGDEAPEQLAEIAALGVPIVRALRLDAAGLAPIDAYLARCQELSAFPAAILLDAAVAGQYGGTGQTADWSLAAQWHEPGAGSATRPRMILAGGLVPENVAEAIRAVQPYGVDTASGIESAPGVKDPQRMRSFVQNARAALHGRMD